jgi:hypothetical protein
MAAEAHACLSKRGYSHTTAPCTLVVRVIEKAALRASTAHERL